MRRSRTTTRLLASAGLIVTSLVATGGTLLVTAGPAGAADTTLVDETFRGDFGTGAWRLLEGGACLTAADGVVGEPTDNPDGGDGCGVIEEDLTSGYLRLTDAQANRASGVVYTDPLPTDQPLTFEFEQFQYGGSGGEGITFFLADGDADITMPGADGPSLGYSPATAPTIELRSRRAQRGLDSEPGIEGAYLGVGFDAAGGFSTSSAEGDDCPDVDDGPFGGFTMPNSVVLRDGARTTEGGASDPYAGYCLQDSAGAPGSLRGDKLEDALRTFRVVVSPSSGSGVTVDVSMEVDGQFQNVLTSGVSAPVPESGFQFGFTASTGQSFDVPARAAATRRGELFGFTDTHLIRNLTVTTPRRTPTNPNPPSPDPQPAAIPTTTDLTVTRNGMVAEVYPPARVNPPTGEVVFSADGEELDTVELEVVDGVATAVSDETVPPGEDVDFTAEYLGEGDYQPSEDLYERVDPTITARVITDEEPNEAGWYSDPLRIAFSCTRGSAPIVGGCPDRVYRKNTHPRKFFERSIVARDGGGDTVVVPIRVDHRGPVITVHRAKGSPYPRDARPIRCTAVDGRSGVKRECWVEYGEFETLSNGRVRRHFTVRSTDVAGNISVRRLTFWIERDR